MTQLTLYHNPRCSKSRAALALLEAEGLTPTLRLYIDEPPTIAELRDLLQKRGIGARELLRSSETDSRERKLDAPGVSDDTIIAAMCEEPRLIQRPIAVVGTQAVVGRPPERVLELL